MICHYTERGQVGRALFAGLRPHFRFRLPFNKLVEVIQILNLRQLNEFLDEDLELGFSAKLVQHEPEHIVVLHRHIDTQQLPRELGWKVATG